MPEDEHLGQQLTAALCEGLAIRGAALYLVAPEDGDLRPASVHGQIDLPERIDAAALYQDGGEPFPLQALPLASNAAGKPVPAQPLCLGLRVNGAALGLIVLGPTASGDGFAPAEAALLAMVAAQIGVLLQRAEYARRIHQQRVEIERLQQRLDVESVEVPAETRSLPPFQHIIGTSSGLQRALQVVATVGPTDASVLITGETGTGKELIARALHNLSARRSGPFVCVNCGAIPADLAESELFGHERGAFTGAVKDHAGRFEAAHGGTIFLDEVGELSPELQVKLLRVLQEREVQRVGGQVMRKLDLRILAATNRDLGVERGKGRFRDDLFYRLAAVQVELPALRERVSDIPALASFILENAAKNFQRPVKGFTAAAMDALCRHAWPGNIRELQNVVERAVLLCATDVIRPENLSTLAPARRDHDPTQRPLGDKIREEKRRHVEIALVQTRGNRAAAARLLGMSRSNLGRLLKSLKAESGSLSS